MDDRIIFCFWKAIYYEWCKKKWKISYNPSPSDNRWTLCALRPGKGRKVTDKKNVETTEMCVFNSCPGGRRRRWYGVFFNLLVETVWIPQEIFFSCLSLKIYLIKFNHQIVTIFLRVKRCIFSTFGIPMASSLEIFNTCLILNYYPEKL